MERVMSTILLDEDNEMNRVMLTRRLVRKGFAVIIASARRRYCEIIEVNFIRFDCPQGNSL